MIVTAIMVSCVKNRLKKRIYLYIPYVSFLTLYCDNFISQEGDRHQDDTIDYNTLRTPAQLNVDCDKGAKKCMNKSELDTTRPIPAPGSRAALSLGNEMVTSHIQNQIQYAGQADERLTYIADNFEWTDAQARCVNYTAIDTVKKQLSDSRSIWTSKFMHGWLNIGTQKEKNG